MFEVSKLCFSYNKKYSVFSNISFSLNAGEILSIVGLNGAGKTTLLKCLTQSIKDYTGEVKYAGNDLRRISFSDRSKIIGLVTIGDIVRCDISVLDYLCMGLANQVAFFSSPNSDHYKQAIKMCQKYNVLSLSERSLLTLSQGEMQVITILRVLMQNPKIIIMDEPTAALDLCNQRKLLELNKELLEDGKIIIQVTHNVDHIFDLKGKVLVLTKAGYSYGEYDEILTEEKLTEIYGIKVKLAQFDGQIKVLY